MNKPPKDHPAALAAENLEGLIASTMNPRAPLTSQALQSAVRYFAREPAAQSLVTLAQRLDGRFVAIVIDREGAAQNRFTVIWNFGR